MPELPEVETVRRGLDKALAGATINKVELRRENLRTPFPKDFAKSLTGQKIKSVTRRAKYLLFHLDSDIIMVAHLGMTRRFTVAAPQGKGKKTEFLAHDHVVLTLDDGRLIIYNDARRFGLMEICKRKEVENHKLFRHLAPEPLESEFTPEYLEKALSKLKTPIKPTIMDQ